MFYSERLKRWEWTLEMYWLKNFIEIILFEEFCEPKTMWQKLFNASSHGLGKLREYRFLQMKSGKTLPDYLRSEKKIIIPSHGPANSLQRWFCQVIRIQMEETFIIVTYYTLPEVTAPEKLRQDKNKAISRENSHRPMVGPSSHSPRSQSQTGWGWLWIRIGPHS